MKYLIDTDWLIDHLNGVKKIREKLDKLAIDGLAISIVTLAEVYEGVFYSRDPESSERALEAFIPGIYILDLNEEICRIFGKERGKLRKRGQIIGDLDIFIAATCLYHDLTLLSNNVNHFERVDNLRIISL